MSSGRSGLPASLPLSAGLWMIPRSHPSSPKPHVSLSKEQPPPPTPGRDRIRGNGEAACTPPLAGAALPLTSPSLPPTAAGNRCGIRQRVLAASGQSPANEKKAGGKWGIRVSPGVPFSLFPLGEEGDSRGGFGSPGGWAARSAALVPSPLAPFPLTARSCRKLRETSQAC